MDHNTKRIYLIKQSALLEPGIKIDNKDEWISFGNMQIKVKDGIDDPNDIKLLTENTLADALKKEIDKDPKRFKGADGKSVDIKGNKDNLAAIEAITNPAVDEAWVDKEHGVLYIWNGTAWVSLGQPIVATEKSQFRIVSRDGKDVMEPGAGLMVVMRDVSGTEIVSDDPMSVAKRHDVLDRTQANDWMELPKPEIITFSTDATGGPIGNLEHFGDIDQKAERDNFMDNVNIGEWYSFSIKSIPYLAVITSGDKTTNFQWTGYRVITGGTGKTIEVVNGSTTPVGHAEFNSSVTGDMFSGSLVPVAAYSELQFLPKVAINQLIRDEYVLLDGRVWLDIAPNQISGFSGVINAGKFESIGIKHGAKINTDLNSDGHPIQDNMIIAFEDSNGQIMRVRYNEFQTGNVTLDPNGVIKTDGYNVRQSIYDANGVFIGSFFPKVTKITDWEGSNPGWSIEFIDPRDKNGTPKFFDDLVVTVKMTLIGMNVAGTETEIKLTPSDLARPIADWITDGASNHLTGSFTKGYTHVWNVIDARHNVVLGAWDGSHQWGGRTIDMDSIAIGRPRYLILAIWNDWTAGYQYYARVKFELVKADGTVAVDGDTVDYTKIKMTYEGAKGAQNVGNHMVEDLRTFTGFDLQEVI